MFKNIFAVFCLFLFIGCSSLPKSKKYPENEFRAIWIATVVNIDWPKNGTDAIDKQKRDFLALLDFYKALNFNVAIVQIRTAGDAFYDSKFAPWSRFLTGKEGSPTSANFNMMSWMISETHKRGMEFHAWFNPYRATFDKNTEILSPTHDYNIHPEWMIPYGNKYYYNPGNKAVQDNFTKLINEAVSQYNLDAVHFDDYFYPYTIKNEVFNDSISFSNNKLKNQTISDWRRSNIDSLVSKVHRTIKETKPWVKFGVSPFGVWKNSKTDPKGSNTNAGQTTYENLYADPLLWAKKGWIDYLIPQIYWSMDFKAASHKTLVAWWDKQNLYNTKLYIGNGPYKIRNNKDQSWNDKNELINQLKLGRSTPNVSGNAFFSAKSFLGKNKDIAQLIYKKLYKKKANPNAVLDVTSLITTPISGTLKNGEYQFSFPTSLNKTAKTVLVLKSSKNQRPRPQASLNGTGKGTEYASKNNFSFQDKSRDIKPPGRNKGSQIITKVYISNSGNFVIPKNILSKQKHLYFRFLDAFGHPTSTAYINLKSIHEQ